MNQLSNFLRGSLLVLLTALTASVAGTAHAAAAATPRVDEKELLSLGFKVLVATTPAQTDWVKRLAPGKIRAMQRTGKKFFIYPDAANNQVYVGGPKEYDAYKQLHPDDQLAGAGSAKAAADYRSKQDLAMKKSTERDLSNPYYWVNTATWADLGW
jgi:hypothetical protein